MNARDPSRYTIPRGIEAQHEPGSHGRVPRNLLGIKSKREMDRAEYEALLSAQTSYVDLIHSDTRFTAKLICQMHKDWLGKIYEWAGGYRSVELEKDGFRWPPAFRVDENMQRFEEGELARFTPSRLGSLEEVTEHIARVHAELLLIHPFREGNGRLARWVAGLMAMQAGFPSPSYRLSGPGSAGRRKAYLLAVRAGYAGDYALLTAFFREAIERRLREKRD